MLQKYIVGFIVISSVLYANDRPDSGRTNFIKTKVSFGNANIATGGMGKIGLLSASHNGYRQRYIKRHKGYAMQSSRPVRFQPGLYQKISLDDFGTDQGSQRDGLVKDIKSEMLRLGCYWGKVDAVWGQNIRNALEVLDRGLPTLTAEKVTLNYLKKQRTLGCDGNRGWDKLTTEGKGVRVTGSIKTVASEEGQTQPQTHTPKKRTTKIIRNLKSAIQSGKRKKSRLVQRVKVKLVAPVRKVSRAKVTKIVAEKKPALKREADKKLVQSVLKKKTKPKRRRKRYVRKKFGTHSVFGLDSF